MLSNVFTLGGKTSLPQMSQDSFTFFKLSDLAQDKEVGNLLSKAVQFPLLASIVRVVISTRSISQKYQGCEEDTEEAQRSVGLHAVSQRKS